MSDKPEYKHQNIQFLLLVNKKCPELGEVFTTFNASFEITATPLYDITSLLSAYVESKSKGIFIHNYSGNSKNAFILSGAPLKMSNQDLTYYNINSYSSAKSIQSPTSYTVNAYFDTETRYDFENKTPGITTLPTIQNISRNMAITYDYKSGDLKIITYSHITNKYETTYEEKPRIVKSSEWFENGSMNLAKIMVLTPNSDGILFFKTDNTTETKASIKNMSFSHRELNFNIDTGAITSEKYSSYIDTDYSTEDVVLILLMNSE